MKEELGHAIAESGRRPCREEGNRPWMATQDSYRAWAHLPQSAGPPPKSLTRQPGLQRLLAWLAAKGYRHCQPSESASRARGASPVT
jgi:hypothetical protein